MSMLGNIGVEVELEKLLKETSKDLESSFTLAQIYYRLIQRMKEDLLLAKNGWL